MKKKRTGVILSIIIISYNTKQITIDCIESIYRSLKKSDLDLSSLEILVVDNNSTDGSQAALRTLQKKYPMIRLIENKTNTGFGKANNQAVQKARGSYILFLNSDIIVLDNAIEDIFSYYKKHENTIHFLGGKLFNKDMTPQPSCGPFFSLPVVFGFLFLKGDHWGLTRFSPDKPCKTDWVSGACILTKKKYFQNLKGFDEDIFMYMEEVELLYRAKQHEYQTFFYDKACFIHLGSASSKKSYPIIQAYQGFLYLYQKHYGKISFFILKNMLQWKALISIGIGKIIKSHYLVTTYEKAYKMVTMA